MAFLMNGTISFLRSAKTRMSSNKKKPATQKNPAAALLNKPASHQATPVKAKIKKKIAKKKAAMPIIMAEAALEAPAVAFSFDIFVYVFKY